MDRRTFIAAGSTALVGSLLGHPLRADAAPGALSVRATSGGPLITPNNKFFVYSQQRDPEKTPTGVQIDGLVNTPARYSLDDLAKLPVVKKIMTLECFSNTAGGALIFNTPFEGVLLSTLFDKAGLKPEARSVRVETSDGHAPFVLPLSEVQRPMTMLVSKHGSETIPLRHGSPFTRLFIPGAGGNHHPKWVTRITAIANDSKAHDAPPMAGFIDPPPPAVRGSMSGVKLTGYAFSGPEAVGKVEVSTDNGYTYRAMPLPPQPDPDVWITFDLTFTPPEPGFYVLRIKATSAKDRKQDFPGVIAVQIS
jgi:DMSO/TMAO reductase YedYZ molybdopterin-dependent catalytic subunit